MVFPELSQSTMRLSNIITVLFGALPLFLLVRKLFSTESPSAFLKDALLFIPKIFILVIEVTADKELRFSIIRSYYMDFTLFLVAWPK